ncbi:methyltransferase RsmF C-terminal domain-like protein [Cognataquiflexum rubidum]|uniref:methyltransferase RsmF C-terminal domain-like protein n=1 Tax=Cognataquiflexum rubidum TaxID=2922273 RepID=UPI001F1298AC|nr:tRNA/rRNA cytosine-C5-methylase [Cognataquiflexum rubidum]MCH6233843.1 tRNA/rRNA cytosine-C5-methylase [Cognataquiflexum rubidum]
MSKINLPKAFESQMKSYLGENEFREFAKALEKEPKVSIRINRHKTQTQPENSILVPWNEDGYFLEERPSFTLDPLFHAGCYYVQEASSMFIQHILKSIDAPQDGIYLDLAAAPGGKSTLLSSYLGKNGFLVANEVIKSRASILKENIIKWGIGNTLVTQNDPEHFGDLAGFFDLVLVDAPCSGEGMFRKDPDAMSEWSADHVALCAARQERIMDHAGSFVKGGGYLIYSTCTFNEKENEEMIRFIVSEYDYEPVRIPLDSAWGIVESEVDIDGNSFFGYRFFPHRVEGEGFFITVLKRPENSLANEPKRTKDFKHPYIKPVGKQEAEKLMVQLGLPDYSCFYNLQDSFFWVNKDFQQHFEYLCRFLNIRYFGVELGKINKQQFIPNHELAVSILPKSGFLTYDLDLKEALDYLRKEDIPLKDLPEGWVLVTYKKMPLGWLKNLGNRTNNYYPKDWRIRMK